MFYAATKGHADIVQLLIEYGADTSISAEVMITVCKVSNTCVTSITKYTINQCTTENELNILQNGVNPMYAASLEGHTDVVDALLKAGADPNQACTTVPVII